MKSNSLICLKAARREISSSLKRTWPGHRQQAVQRWHSWKIGTAHDNKRRVQFHARRQIKVKQKQMSVSGSPRAGLLVHTNPAGVSARDVNLKTGENNMLGAYITFAAAGAIVTVYMLIVHHFLRSAEDPLDLEREKKYREAIVTAPPPQPAGRPQYAH
jgi:hypothetical protein